MSNPAEVPGIFPESDDDGSPRAQANAAGNKASLRESADAGEENEARKPQVPVLAPLKPAGEPVQLSDFGGERQSAVRFSEPEDFDRSHNPKDLEDTEEKEKMKDLVKKALIRPMYNVHDLYWDTGYCQKLARSPFFEHVTLFVISVNAIWIAVDTDWNNEAFLPDAHWVFQFAEHSFCAFFTFEWLVRFCSFQSKCAGFTDYWFLFDTILVTMMVAETWVMTIVISLSGGAGGGPLGSTGVLRLFRLLRLSRMARMLRRCPELMILIKGMVAACRSVFFTLLFLVIVMYMFAIALTQLSTGTDVGEDYFDSIPDSMFTLLVVGTFQDNILEVMTEIGRESWAFAAVFLLFVVIGALMIMNMLIGVLCEVVSEVADQEREEMNAAFVRSKMLDVVMRLDKDGDMEISRDEFVQIMQDTNAVRALEEVGVDAFGLVEMSDFMFKDEETHEDKVLSFCEFMDCILDFRGSNKATVKDFVDLRKFLKKSFKRVGRNFTRSSMRMLGTMMSDSKNLGKVMPPDVGPRAAVPVDVQLHIGRLEAFLTAGLFELQRAGGPADNLSLGTWGGKKQLLPALPGSQRMQGLTAMSELDLSRLLKRVNKFVAFAIDEIQTVRAGLPLPGANDEQSRDPQLQDLRVELAKLEEQLLTFGPDGTLSIQVALPIDTSELQLWVEKKVPQINAALSALQLAQERLSSTGSASSHDAFRQEVSEEVS